MLQAERERRVWGGRERRRYLTIHHIYPKKNMNVFRITYLIIYPNYFDELRD